MTTSEGHRERLRQKFQHNPNLLSEVERLELLLTYAIPRRDVAPLSRDLVARFGNARATIAAASEDLIEIAGVGESTVTFLRLLRDILMDPKEEGTEVSTTKDRELTPQPTLFELAPEVEEQELVAPAEEKRRVATGRQMRVFANDEIANSITFLPKAARFRGLEDFRNHLAEKLPYNATETRHRRANNIIERFYPEGRIDTPLTYFGAHCSTQVDLKPAIFYHILKAEPIAAKVAEELIWSALPIGQIEREQLREFVLHYLPDIGDSSQKNMLRSLFNAYDLLEIGKAEDTLLHFHLHQGTLESFLYILTGEYSEPGMYTFDSLYSSPLQRWLLWDREWIRRQLYNLQDFGILAKVSEIDTVRQFTLTLDQSTALRRFYEHPKRALLPVREVASDVTDEEEPDAGS